MEGCNEKRFNYPEYSIEEKLIAWLRFNELYCSGKVSYEFRNGVCPQNALDLFEQYPRSDVYTIPDRKYIAYYELFDKKYTKEEIAKAKEELEISLKLQEESRRPLNKVVRKKCADLLERITHLKPKKLLPNLILVIGVPVIAPHILSEYNWHPKWLFWLLLALYVYVNFDIVKMLLKPSVIYTDSSALTFYHKTTLFDFVIMHLSILFVLFVVVSYLGFRCFGNEFIVIVNGDEGDFSWFFYGLDNLVRAVFFDIAEIYSIDLSQIEHANNFYAATFVVVFRTVIGASCVTLIWNAMNYQVMTRR